MTTEHDGAVSGARGWFAGRLPEEWTEVGPAEVSVDKEEIVVRLLVADPVVAGATARASDDEPDDEPDDEHPDGTDDVERAEARAGRAQAFRERTRKTRMKLAKEAHHRFGRTVSWGVRVGPHEELWTHVSAPVMTRLRQPQRQVLDTLVDVGVARSRSEALAWCVRLVGQHEDAWLSELREAMTAVDDVRRRGPAA